MSGIPVLTAHGALAAAYLERFPGRVVSAREHDRQAFATKITEADVVINNAGSIGSPDPAYLEQSNLGATRALIDVLVARAWPGHLIHISSMSVLDPSDASSYADEATMSHYARTKYRAERYVLDSGLARASVVRFGTLAYGDPDRDGLSRLVYDAASAGAVDVLDGGKARRAFLPIDVAAEYLQRLATAAAGLEGIYDFAPPTSTSFREIVDMLERLLPNLRVQDTESLGRVPEVLHEFDLAAARRLGLIDFSIEDWVAAYSKGLRR